MNYNNMLKILAKPLLLIILLLIKFYQYIISPLFFNSCCRFYPSCSEYAKQAILKYGIKGMWLGMKRILKCHPYHDGGVDEVP